MNPVEFYKDAEGQYQFRVKAGNGEIVATGEGYTTAADAAEGVQALRRALDADTQAYVAELVEANERLSQQVNHQRRYGNGGWIEAPGISVDPILRVDECLLSHDLTCQRQDDAHLEACHGGASDG